MICASGLRIDPTRGMQSRVQSPVARVPGECEFEQSGMLDRVLAGTGLVVRGGLAKDCDALWLQQFELPVRSYRQVVNVETGGDVVRRLHDRRRRRHNRKPTTLSDPVDMPMAVHE